MEDDAHDVAMSQYLQIPLGDEALQYLRTCLADGRSLSRHLLQQLDLSRGSISTRLPKDADATHLSEFEWGGKLKPIDGGARLVTDAAGGQHEMTPVPNTRPDLVTVIMEFLSRAPNAVAVFENPVSKPSDPWLPDARSRVVTFRDEVYHVACDADADEIQATITEADSAFSLVGVLAQVNLPQCQSAATQEFREEDLIRCADAAETIIVSAYDGEAYLFWTVKRHGDE